MLSQRKDVESHLLRNLTDSIRLRMRSTGPIIVPVTGSCVSSTKEYRPISKWLVEGDDSASLISSTLRGELSVNLVLSLD